MKQIFRQKLLEKRKNLASSFKKRADKKIREKLFSLPYFKKAKVIFLYISKDDETDTLEIVHHLGKIKKTIVTPKVHITKHHKILSLQSIEHPSHLEKGNFGIFEPKKDRPKIKPEKIQVALVPAIAFDKYGHRIGYGHGYFDRLLKKLSCIKIGLAYDFQMLAKIKTHPYDVPVDVIVTDKKIYRAKQNPSA